MEMEEHQGEVYKKRKDAENQDNLSVIEELQSNAMQTESSVFNRYGNLPRKRNTSQIVLPGFKKAEEEAALAKTIA